MPKVTIYVPDRLLARLKSLNAGVNMSQLFQSAILEEVRRQEGRAMQSVLLDEHADLGAVRERFQAARQDVYQDGYKEGLRVARKLDYSDFATLDDYRWDPVRVHNFYRDEFEDQDLPTVTPFWRGLTAALRDVWLTVNEALDQEDEEEFD